MTQAGSTLHEEESYGIGGFQWRFNWILIQTCNMNEGSSVNTDLSFS